MTPDLDASRVGAGQQPDVVCFAVIDWEFRWQRPQQMMARLAQEGHRVYYVSPTRFLTTSSRPFELHPLRDNVWEVRLRLPQAFDIYGRGLPADLAHAALEALADLQAAEGLTRAASVVQIATWAAAAVAARDAFGWPIVYDCMDDWEHFPGVSPELLSEERRLVGQADVVAVSAQALWDKWAAQSRRPVLARNAADFDHFHAPPAEDPLPDVGGRIAGYFGAIASWFDVPLVARLARAHPDVTFVLVGDIFDVPLAELRALGNVRFTGPQPYARMPAYLARFDVCLVPFLLNDATRAMDVVKFYEYVSQGKPVVASALPELAPYRELLYLARDGAEAGRLFAEALVEADPARRERRIALARENTWGQRAALIMGALAEAEAEGARMRLLMQAMADALSPAGQRDPAARAATAELVGRMVREFAAPAAETSGADAAALRSVAVGLVRTLAEREQAVRALSRRLTRSQQLIGEQQESIEFLTREREGLQAARASLEEAVEFLTTKREGLEAAKASLEEAVEFLKQDRDQTRATLEEAIAFVQQERDDYRRQADFVRGELDLVLNSRAWRAAEKYRRLRSRVSGLVGRVTHPRSPAPSPPASPAAGQAAAVSAPPTAAVVLPQGFPALPSRRHDVIVFSIIDWDFRFQRPQQLGTQFGRHGHRTLYLSTTRFLPPRGPAGELLHKAGNVAELRVRAWRTPNVYQGRLTDVELRHLEDAFVELAGQLGVGDAVSMVQVPFWTPLAFRLRERLGWPVVYDCMDEWANFPGFGPEVLAQEDALFAEADLTVVSADRLVEKAQPRARRLVLARNGVDVEHYRRRYEPNTLLDPVRRPVIGYYGALASWVDVPLLSKIARRFADATIVLAGGHFDVDLSALERMPNVRLLGQRPYSEMPPLLWNIDVCIIPFLVNDITQATNPVKFYEYLYGEKPVVAPDLVELRPYAELCYLARDHDEFLRHIEDALRESPDDPRRPRRRQVAMENDWSARYDAIEAGIADSVPLVSVVVVAYGGLELTKACLRSLLQDETWPRLEVIVVDNASADETAAWLREAEAGEPRLRAILNAENRGFAAANNQGIAASAGDVVVLLNNDTVVPPGLLGRLAHHLRRDPALGLLCPTTNFCGNEAKVEPDYGSDLGGLAAYAARRAREHRGRVIDLSVAAMYCVAARREVLDQVGALDEAFGVGLFEDDDFSLRVRQAGWRVACAEDAYVHHVGQGSFRKLTPEEYDALWKRNQQYFETKWGTSWQAHQTRSGVAPPVSNVPAAGPSS